MCLRRARLKNFLRPLTSTHDCKLSRGLARVFRLRDRDRDRYKEAVSSSAPHASRRVHESQRFVLKGPRSYCAVVKRRCRRRRLRASLGHRLMSVMEAAANAVGCSMWDESKRAVRARIAGRINTFRSAAKLTAELSAHFEQSSFHTWAKPSTSFSR